MNTESPKEKHFKYLELLIIVLMLAGLSVVAVMVLPKYLSSSSSTNGVSSGVSSSSSSISSSQQTPPGLPPGGVVGGNGGTPPSGSFSQGGMPQGDQNATKIEQTVGSSGYSQNGGSVSKSDVPYSATNQNESAVIVDNSGSLTLSNASISKTGDTTTADQSSFYGLNAGIISKGGSSVTISDSTISASGKGANGAFSNGEGSSLTLSNVKIDAFGDGAHAVMATQGGTISMTNVTMNTTDAHSGAVATDRGSGTITGSKLIVTTSGADSPGIYSTGKIDVSDSTISSTGAEAAVIEGANSISLTDVSLSTSISNKWGVMIYQSFSGDAEGTDGVFNMTNGSLSSSASSGPLFYITNSTGIINLSKVNVTAGSGVLLKAEANSRWGTSGSNGGNAVLSAKNQVLKGSLVADGISTIKLDLADGSSLDGAVNADKVAKSVSVSLDSSSSWSLSADSYVTVLSDSDGISGSSVSNIKGNGHNLYYSSSANSSLNGITYALANGGSLMPY